MSPNSERQDAGVGQGLCLGGTCFGSFAELALSPSVKSCLSDRNRGCVGDGGRQGGGAGASGQTSTYTTDVCSEKYRESSCKYNRESASSHRWHSACCSPRFCQSV